MTNQATNNKIIYLPIYLSDYVSQSRKLSMLQRGALIDLSVLYFQENLKISYQKEQIYRLVFAFEKAEKDAIDFILENFFKQEGDKPIGLCWVSQELNDLAAKVLKRLVASRENGKKGGRGKKKNAKPIGYMLGSLDQNLDKSILNEIKLNEIKLKETKRNETNFLPPTLQEVEKYCQERNSRVNPKNFHEYYSAGNWKDSQGNQVKNWKQKLLTWEKKDNIPTQGGANSAKNEDMAIFINNLCKDTLINSIIISASNKAVFRFNKKEGYEKFMKLSENLRNEIKEKVSKELGTVGFDINY